MVNYEVFPKNLIFSIAHWLEDNFDIILLVPHMGVIGNCSEEIYFGLIKARKNNKKLLLIWPYELYGILRIKLPNIEVMNLNSELLYLNFDSYSNKLLRLLFTTYIFLFSVISKFKKIIFGSHLTNGYIRPTLGANYLWHPRDVDHFSWDVVNKMGWISALQDPLKVDISKERKEKSEQLREKMGVPIDQWYVCLHVREAGFRDNKKYKEGQLYTERNANIASYIEAIKLIVDRGGMVIRMGDSSMTKLPEMAGVIDYPFTEYKSSLMDVYLISECKFYIGMISGIYDLARLFQKPMILTNMNNWMWGYPALKGDLGIFKHVYSKSKNKFLSLAEWINEPWDAVSYSHPIGKDYIFFENSAEEIKSVVLEYLNEKENLVSRQKLDEQAEFDTLRAMRGREIVGNSIFNLSNVQDYFKENVSDYDLLERYRLASRLDSAVGSIGEKFLVNNWRKSSRENAANLK
jgi:putative glycosyltransferase (TIGR04372 family)